MVIPKEIVIPSEKAMFRMDARGRWHSPHGPFRKQSIIAHFNRSIGKDEGGYFVRQVNGDCIEKVYFTCEDTAFFVVDVIPGARIRLILNTGEELPLLPEALFIQGDQLYMTQGDRRIKFSERGLLRLADMIEGDGETYILKLGQKKHPIPILPSDMPR